MDPPTLMNDGSFPNNADANASPATYIPSEIWKFPIIGGTNVEESGGVLGLRMPHFAHNLGQFGDIAGGNRQVSLQLQQTVVHGHGSSRKRHDAEQDSAKNECNGKRSKAAACREDNHDSKTEAEPSSGKPVEENSHPPADQLKQDYIHVRARRGQATDSHSLAERARREKISERMKILQDLVPGCNKVIGKALVLDEIINYIQSLQHQVEFLSMKLEAVNSRMGPGIEVFPSKDYGQQTYDADSVALGSQATREYSRGSSPEWLHMQIGGGFART